MEQAELAEKFNAMGVKIDKIGTEISGALTALEELKAQLDARDDVSPELLAAYEAVEAKVQAVDDLITDETTGGETPADEEV